MSLPWSYGTSPSLSPNANVSISRQLDVPGIYIFFTAFGHLFILNDRDEEFASGDNMVIYWMKIQTTC